MNPRTTKDPGLNRAHLTMLCYPTVLKIFLVSQLFLKVTKTTPLSSHTRSHAVATRELTQETRHPTFTQKLSPPSHTRTRTHAHTHTHTHTPTTQPPHHEVNHPLPGFSFVGKSKIFLTSSTKILKLFPLSDKKIFSFFCQVFGIGPRPDLNRGHMHPKHAYCQLYYRGLYSSGWFRPTFFRTSARHSPIELQRIF